MLLNSNEPPSPLTTKLFFYPWASQKQTHVNSDQHKNMNTKGYYEYTSHSQNAIMNLKTPPLTLKALSAAVDN